jgi:hypothetical protein
MIAGSDSEVSVGEFSSLTNVIFMASNFWSQLVWDLPWCVAGIGRMLCCVER